VRNAVQWRARFGAVLARPFVRWAAICTQIALHTSTPWHAGMAGAARGMCLNPTQHQLAGAPARGASLCGWGRGSCLFYIFMSSLDLWSLVCLVPSAVLGVYYWPSRISCTLCTNPWLEPEMWLISNKQQQLQFRMPHAACRAPPPSPICDLMTGLSWQQPAGQRLLSGPGSVGPVGGCLMEDVEMRELLEEVAAAGRVVGCLDGRILQELDGATDCWWPVLQTCPYCDR
jgi:hypothetical protein